MSQHESLPPEPTPPEHARPAVAPQIVARRRVPRVWVLVSAVALCLAVAGPVAAFTVLPSNGAATGSIRLVDATTVDVNASPTWSTTMQAEDAQIQTSVAGYPLTVTENPGFHGAAYLGHWGMSSSVSFTLDAPIDGDYRVTFRYGVAEYDEGASRVLSVDTKTLGTVQFERTAVTWADTNRWKVSTPTVIHLPPGRHTIKLTHNGNPWTNWLDLDEISVVVSAKAPAPTTTAKPAVTTTTAKPVMTTTTAKPVVTTTTAKPEVTTTTAKPVVTTTTAPATTPNAPTASGGCGASLNSLLAGSTGAADSAARIGAVVSSKGCASQNLSAYAG
jgi:hypothetical protein